MCDLDTDDDADADVDDDNDDDQARSAAATTTGGVGGKCLTKVSCTDHSDNGLVLVGLLRTRLDNRLNGSHMAG